MDLINKGVSLIRRSTLTRKHQRNLSQESNTSSPNSPSLCKTPSITSSITSDEGSCYSGKIIINFFFKKKITLFIFFAVFFT